MDNWQLLLDKLIELGNLLAAMVPRVDRNTSDIRDAAAEAEEVRSNIATIKNRVSALESLAEAAKKVREQLLSQRPVKQSNLIAIVALAVSAIGRLVMTWFYVHPVIPHK